MTSSTHTSEPASWARRFGAARVFGFAIAVFLGGYQANSVLGHLLVIVRDSALSLYSPFGDGRARGVLLFLAFCAALFGTLAGLTALFGLVARRWTIGVLVLTVLSVLAQVGLLLLALDSSSRDTFLRPGTGWETDEGLPYTAAALVLQSLVIVFCLIAGRKPVVEDPSVLDETPRIFWADEPSPWAEEADPVEAPPVSSSRAEDDYALGGLDRHDRPTLAAEPADEEPEPQEDADEPEEEPDVFLIIHGEEYGPYTPRRVRDFMTEGRIHPGTLVRIGDERKPVSAVPSIFG
ncbi:MAG: hypothetical protein QM621_10110 [Aeromicrobium sp.]|uniref:hypothetical protein n=1 Tax=Aeromicrobium sp. TaxID=1871063 RepID=UPI0039E6FDE8